ncbi:hypothetical protein CPLU01_14950 [Colletotrichum plurivorum]|uniref:Uncharacterized protein n=1 Tax=Colletotrichum plurivorum TaxID=2175906 RepID=A0A8H6JFG6_9PEZI|nr:hypothetical protein CPLU01_14950 [Colletotrichum plurivorum]
MDYYESLEITRLVVTGLITVASAVLFRLIFSKPGGKHDFTRRWVGFTKAAIGLWTGARVFDFIVSIIYIATRGPQWGRPVSWDAAAFVGLAGSFLDSLAQVAIFLALFYLAHALTQLRTDTDEESDAYRKGKKVTFAAAVLGTLLAAASCIMYLAVYIMQIQSRYGDYDSWYGRWMNIYNLSTVGSIIALTETCWFAACAIGIVVYAVKARKKAMGTPVQQAGSYLVAASGMWLTRQLWWIIYAFTVVYDYLRVTAIIDLFTNLCMILAVLVMLFMLASQERFGLARTLYKRPTGPERAV